MSVQQRRDDVEDRAGAPPAIRDGVRRIDHVAIAVHDIDEALRTYLAFGFTIVHDETLQQVGVRLVYLQPTNPADEGTMTCVQLVQAVGAGPVQEWVATRGEGIHHVCFAVDDLVRFTESLPGEESAAAFRGGRDRRACFLRSGAHGAIIELTELEPFGAYAPWTDSEDQR